MHSHLNIQIKTKDGQLHDLTLADDASISVVDQNPLFHESEMFTYPVSMPLEGNRAIVQNIDDAYSDLRPVSLEHLPARILVDGMPFRSGTLVMSDDEEVDGKLGMNIDANEHSFSDLIDNLKCRDIPMGDDILIGEKIGDVKADITYDYHIYVKYKGKKSDANYWATNRTAKASCNPQALGFSYPGKCEVVGKQVAVKASQRDYPNGHSVIIPKVETSYINTDKTYVDGAKYVNARVCYRHHALDEFGKTSDSIVQAKDSQNQWEDKSPYWVLDADRQQSGICFYVIYFLDCLFKYLGVSFDKSALMEVGDFSRLCFFTTLCKFDERVIHGTSVSLDAQGGTVYTDGDTGKQISSYKPYFSNLDEIQKWLDSRGCGGKLYLEDTENKSVTDCDWYVYDKDTKTWKQSHIATGVDGVKEIKVSATIKSSTITANVMGMYANSKCLPDISVKELLDALEAAFGIRFNYDYEKKCVTAYLVRSVFRSQLKPIDFMGQVISMNKISEKITGFRMIYSKESDSRVQKENVANGKTDYDTTYDYIDYQKDHTVTDKTYTDFFKNLSAGDMNCYVDKRTGNAYRIKVDKDARQASELQPRLFEVGQFHGVELGDCSDLNKDFIEEREIGFTPVEFNDVNYHNELVYVNSFGNTYKDDTGNYKANNINVSDAKPLLAVFVDVEMEHEFVTQKIRNTFSEGLADFYLTEELSLIESYDPKTEDGNSPLQDDSLWGFDLTLMRGGGADADVQSYDYDYDGFGNSKWRTVSGTYAMSSDTMDNMGNIYDYNGKLDDVGGDERFSLKIRAWKQPSWAKEPLCNNDVVDAKTGKITTKIRSRGLFDSFISEYARFLMKRKKFMITAIVTPAQIVDIPNHWLDFYRINGMVGLIDKVDYNISAKTGITEAKITFYAS